MRVLLFTNVYPTKQHPANGMWIVEQVRSLKQKGIEVDVLQINRDESRLNYFIGFIEVIRRFRSGRYDLLHTHDVYPFFLAYLARLLTAAPLLTTTPLPIVYTVHEQELLRARRNVGDLSPLGLLCSPRALLRQSVLGHRLRRLGAAKADYLIVVFRDLLDILCPPGPADIIPCGVDLEKFKPLDRRSCRRQLGIPLNDVVIFFPSDPSDKRKRLYLAQEAVRILRARVPSNTNLIVGGFIPHDRMPLYYNAADAVLQTSVLESSPTIIKEALACETPIVSTDTGDTQDMVKSIPYCFICEDDADALADSLQLALSHEAVGGWERIRQKGLALDQIADRLIGVYGGVLAKFVSAAEVT